VDQRNFIHADTHPGNFFFRKAGRLGVIDFGCVKKFSEEFTHNYMKLLPTHLEGDEQKIRDLYIQLDIIKENPANPDSEEEFFQFCKQFGDTFALPYTGDYFDFGDAQFRDKSRSFAKKLPSKNEPRGDKNFIYSTKVHMGLYNILMKLGAKIDTQRSKKLTHNMIDLMGQETAE